MTTSTSEQPPVHLQAPRRMRRRWARWSMVVVGCALLLLGIQQGRRLLTHNLDVVEPGRLYRSAQLDAEDLEKTIRQFGIRTLVNLRGPNPKQTWYWEERDVCRKLGVRHLDVLWSARALPKPERVSALLAAYREGPYPMLIHCRAGADRTGLAAALYLIDQKQHSVSPAQDTSLNLAHGHLALYPTWAMDEFLVRFKKSGKSLSAWVQEDYPSIYLSESKEGRWASLVDSWRSEE